MDALISQRGAQVINELEPVVSGRAGGARYWRGYFTSSISLGRQFLSKKEGIGL